MLGIALMLIIFALEVSTRVLLGCVGYVLVAFYSLWLLRTSRLLHWLGIAASFFIIASTVLLISLHPDIANDYTHLMERVISLFAVWFAIFFTNRYRSLHEEEQTSLQQIKAIFENSNEGILFSDDKGKIVLANPFIERMLEYKPGELNGKDIRELIPERYLQSHSQYVAGFISKPENRIISRIMWAKAKTNKELPIEINLSHFYRDGVLNIIVFMQDATYKHQQMETQKANLERVRNYNKELSEEVRQRTEELERANQELRKSQHLYESMARNFPDGIIGVLNRDMCYVLADGTGMARLGMSPETIIGEHIFDNQNADVTIAAEQKLARVFEGESVVFDVQLNGTCYNVSCVPLRSGDSQIEEILVVIKDISARKELEDNLMRTLQKEKDLRVMKSRFVSMASHEFRTPLTTILSSVFLLENYKGEQLERESKKLLDRIKRAVHNMTEILNEFLSSGKLDEGKMTVALTEVNLSQFMEELKQEVVLLKRDNQEFEFDLVGDYDQVRTDPQILKNILLNLISNAIKYSKPDGKIKVHVNVNEFEVSISVVDEGVGIPEEEQKYIFQRFFRAHNVSGTQGTGLGLNIVRKYMKLLKGKITFTSVQDKGTTFVATFPVMVRDEIIVNENSKL